MNFNKKTITSCIIILLAMLLYFQPTSLSNFIKLDLAQKNINEYQSKQSNPTSNSDNILSTTSATIAASDSALANRDQENLNLEYVLVSRIVDGDTIELSDGRKVRYIGINTPETKHPSKGKECFGQAANDENSRLVMGKTIGLEKDVSETDRYGRLLRYVWLDGVQINYQLVATGFAQVSTFPPDIKYRADFSDAEKSAREQALGLWNPTNCPVNTFTE